MMAANAATMMTDALSADLEWNFDLGDGHKIDLHELLSAPFMEDVEKPEPAAPKPTPMNDDYFDGCKKRKADQDLGPSRRIGRKKPAGMPKRPLSAYNLFFKTERPKLFKASSARIGFEELGRIIGQRWRSLSDEERRKYEKGAEVDVERYRREMDIFDEARRRRFAGGSGLPKPYMSSSQTTTSSVAKEEESKHPPISRATEITPEPEEGFRLHKRFRIAEEHNEHHPPRTFHTEDQQAGQTPPPPTPPGKRVAVPQGLELVLPNEYGHDQRYKVQYACYRMKASEADAYMRRLTQAPSGSPPAA